MMRRSETEPEFIEFAATVRARLRRTAYLVCGDWETASDLTQEALIRTYVAWPRIERKGGALAYARRCVVTVAIDRSRRRAASEVVVERIGDGIHTPSHEHGVAERDTVLLALRRLAPRQRACVALRFLEDLSVAETALVLGCTEGTVKSQTARGLDTLRGLMTADLQLGESR